MEKLVIGIDAGGTSLRAALARAGGGAVLRTASAGAGNPRSVPVEVLTERLTACVAPLAEAAGAGSVAAVVAGVAGAEPRDPEDAGTRVAVAALRAALRRGGVGAVPVEVYGDTEIAFAAGPGAPESGVVLIAGTGASAARIAGRRQTATADGHGWLLGDEGSGFWIAREALRAALRALDGRGPATGLADRLLSATGGGAGEWGGSAAGEASAGRGDGAGRGGSTEAAASAGGPDGSGRGTEAVHGGGEAGPAATGDAGGAGAAAAGGGAGRVRGRDAAAAPRGDGTGERAAGGGPGAWAGGGAAESAVGDRGVCGPGRGSAPVPRGPEGRSAAARIALVDAGFAGAPVGLARLCPVVVRAAEAGDAVAGAILDEAADRLAETVAVLAPAPGEPLVTTGGLLGPAGPLLPRFTARMRPYGLTPAPVPDGLAGAVVLARAMR
jgi:N-acetylglucosamine kinase-like BadF-type ATPase